MDRTQELERDVMRLNQELIQRERDVMRLNQELIQRANPRVAELTDSLRNLTALARSGGPNAVPAQDALRALLAALDDARMAASGLVGANHV